MVRIALVLGLLSAVGPFAIDMYLPALPGIEADLMTNVAAVQWTLTAYFIAFGLSQLVYGPWADQAGRKVPLYAGLVLFTGASALCALAPSIEWLIFGRFLQGIGGAVLMVVPRAVIRDLYTGAQGTRLMAMVMLVISVSPMLAPLAGSGLLAFGGWRLIFWVLVLAAGLSLLVLTFGLEETLPPERRVKARVSNLLAGARILFRDPVFMGLTFIGGFGMASFFVFIASASFVYVEQFGLTPTGFSLAFAINAVGFFAASQAAGPVADRVGLVPTIRVALTGFLTFTALLLGLALGGLASLPVIVGCLFLANACLGFVIPTTMVMALDNHGEIAGLASSLGGTLQMVVGGLMIAVTAPFFDGTATPMVAVIAGCALAAFALGRWTLPKVQMAPAE